MASDGVKAQFFVDLGAEPIDKARFDPFLQDDNRNWKSRRNFMRYLSDKPLLAGRNPQPVASDHLIEGDIDETAR